MKIKSVILNAYYIFKFLYNFAGTKLHWMAAVFMAGDTRDARRLDHFWKSW